MNLQSVKNISIKKYLSSIGCEPAIDRGYYGMFYAPYRKDTQASLKVDFEKNIWVDYSTTQGGSILDLVMKLEQCDFRSAVQSLQNCQLEKYSFSFHCSKPISKQPTRIKVNKIKKLENIALLEYLQSRAIDIQIAQQYCKECYYSVANKNYFAIAFQNNTGGYELRSKYFKGCTNKGITWIQNGSDTLLVFEGFIDYLSYLTYNKSLMLPNDSIILNSVSNIQQAKASFSSYSKVNLHLDNDSTGKALTKELVKEFQHIVDCSYLYQKYKDFNDFLMAV